MASHRKNLPKEKDRAVSPKRAKRRPRGGIAWSLGAVAAIVLLGSLLLILALAKNLPSVTEVGEQKISQSTKIYDRTGKILLHEIHAGKKRTVIALADIPQYLKDATIVTEDEKFYRESSFSWVAIGRALFVNLLHGRILQGGSTITQQLAKNAFLASEQTLQRKIKEFILAFELSRHYSKDQILSLYLNQIPYGPTAYGVEAASELYFNKPVKDLDLAESAFLAALPRAPSYYSPWGSHLDELTHRERYILKRMRQFDKIDQKQLDAAVAEKVAFAPRAATGIRAPHFVETVEDYLAQKYGEDTLREAGLKVITTLDWSLQQLAEKVVTDGAERNERLYQGKNAALVAQDPKTGQVLAMVGSRDYFDKKNSGNFNVAVQGLRQPGSALKPFAYLTLFQKGYSPDTVLFDVPTEFAANNPLCPAAVDFSNDNSACFHPQNFTEIFSGPAALRRALAQSINVPAVKVLYLAGLDDTLGTLHRFGITTLNEPSRYGLSLVLGGGEVKLIDLVEAYSVLAQEGVKHEQTKILEIRDSNNQVLESYQDKNEIVADPQYPRMINDILSDAESRADLFHASLALTVFPDYDVALKTGTSNDYRDAWAMGYTPSLLVGVWAGNNDGTPMQRHGGSILAAVPIWHNFLVEALKGEPKETFNRPAPTPESKPMLNGNYQANKQIHSILFYVNKSDPLGAPHNNPGSDPQFANWEAGAVRWAQTNLPNFSEYNQVQTPVSSAQPPVPEKKSFPPAVSIVAPAAGSFIDPQIVMAADITADSSIKEIRVYFNGLEAGNFPGDFGTQYHFAWSFAPAAPDPQNLLEIEAVDENGSRGRSQSILYK